MNSTVCVTATIHFLDRTSLVVRWPRRSGLDPATIASKLRQSLDAPQLSFAIDDELLVVPMRSVKYIVIDPAPTALPDTVITGATIAAEDTSFDLEE